MKKGVRNKGKRFLLLFIPAILAFIYTAGIFGGPLRADVLAAFSVLHSFTGSDGSDPPGSLTLSGSTFYGMTKFGGSYGYGTIFKINTDGSGFQLLYAFSGGDGGWPLGSLTLLGSTLYGTTSFGGSYDGGTIFQINTDGSGFQLLHSFDSQSDGDAPCGSLTLSGSTLYGMTSSGGPYAFGTIFQINTDGSGFQLRHSFGSQSDGATPCGSLTLSGSTLYGMTSEGGPYISGTVFEINTDGSGFQLLHSFNSLQLDGSLPSGSFALSGSTLYGTTSIGGYYDGGTIFQISTDGSGFQFLHSFNLQSEGGEPCGSLTISGSTLYGMNSGGGLSGIGTIFQINTDGSGFQLLHNFTGSQADGSLPYGSLNLSGSTLYGMTSLGGVNGCGTIFSFTPPSPTPAPIVYDPDLTGIFPILYTNPKGKTVKGIFQVQNIGNVATAHSFRVLLYLSMGRSLGVYTITKHVPPGGVVNLKISKTFTKSVIGQYVIGVVDTNRQIPDSNRTNSVVVSNVLEP